ncbi:glycosyltransferase [Haematococcus lacustris]|uniref:Glycosyltransferase n=1 Tax=Haematococcus lacustris TaxID=44745 RepID=A0A699ZKD8_HAELA|nr:glycosyltransferase [Haematococcus lacustris]
MGPMAFAALNYTQKKAYNVQGLHMQLDAVYAGIGLAAMFNRSIIVPRIACYCDRYVSGTCWRSSRSKEPWRGTGPCPCRTCDHARGVKPATSLLSSVCVMVRGL